MAEHKKTEEEKLVAYITGEPDMKPEPEIVKDEPYQELAQIWELTGTAYSYRNSNPDKAWLKLSKEIGAETKIISKKRFFYFRYAAIFIALVALGAVTLLLLTRNQTNTPEQLIATSPEVKSVQTGSKPATITTVMLPDGSIVKLNASSSLQYPEQFASASRKVKLSGEAYFEVVHDASHPFVVEINDFVVEDLGTSFNISAYPGKEQVEVNVTTGSVRLREKNQKEGTILAQGTSGKLLTKNGKTLISNELSTNFLSWITKEVTFHHTPLSTVFEELENIYHVRIEFTDPKIANISYTANFAKFQLEDIVNVIARTHHLSVSKHADGYVFDSK